jgi:membrane associated rhomboid family serine protease
MSPLPPFPPPPAGPGFGSEPDSDLTSPVTTFGDLLRRATPRVFVTPALVALNVAVFVLMVAKGVSPVSPTTGDLFAWGADYGPAVVVGGEWWRLLTSAFVHIGVIHLALNMYVLWGVGHLAERVYGNGAYLFLYLVAAVGGSLISTAWSPLAVSAGASGAVFGVYGAILAFTAFSRGGLPESVTAGLQKGALSFIAYNVLFGLSVPGISNSAHLGGLGAGFLAGLLLRRDLTALDAPEATGRIFRGGVCLAVLAGLAWAVDVRVSNLPSVKAGRLADEAAGLEEKDPRERDRGSTRRSRPNPETKGSTCSGDGRGGRPAIRTGP